MPDSGDRLVTRGDGGYAAEQVLIGIGIAALAMPGLLMAMWLTAETVRFANPNDGTDEATREWRRGNAQFSEAVGRADSLRVCADPGPFVVMEHLCVRSAPVGFRLVEPPSSLGPDWPPQMLDGLIACFPTVEPAPGGAGEAVRARWCIAAAPETSGAAGDSRAATGYAYGDGPGETGVLWGAALEAAGADPTDPPTDRAVLRDQVPQLFPDAAPAAYEGRVDDADRNSLVLFWAGDDDAGDTNDDGAADLDADLDGSPDYGSGMLLPQYELNDPGGAWWRDRDSRGGAPPARLLATNIEWWCLLWRHEGPQERIVDPCPSEHDPAERYLRHETLTGDDAYAELAALAAAAETVPSARIPAHFAGALRWESALAERSARGDLAHSPAAAIEVDSSPIVRDWLNPGRCAAYLSWGSPGVWLRDDADNDMGTHLMPRAAPDPAWRGGFLPVLEADAGAEPEGVLPQHSVLDAAAAPGGSAPQRCYPDAGDGHALTLLGVVACGTLPPEQRFDYTDMFGPSGAWLFDPANPDWTLWPKHCERRPEMIAAA